MKPLCKLMIVMALILGASGAMAHEFVMPATVAADGAGHFTIEVVVTITATVGFSSTMVNGLDNTSLGQAWVDGFCMGDWAPGIYPTTLEGDLLDPGIGGSVYYEHNMCDSWQGSGTTVVVPPAVAAEHVAWGQIKGIYR